MAKATTAASGKGSGKDIARGGAGRTPRPQPAAEGSGGSGNYFASVVAELRKVTWPAMPDLVRMTQVVIATVILFAVLIGGLDFVLGYLAKPLYTQQGTSAPTVTAPPVPTLKPVTTPPAAASGAASPAPTAHPSATP